jgi:hypothetical protein
MNITEVVVAFLIGIAFTLAFLNTRRPTLQAPASRQQVIVDRWARLITASEPLIAREERRATRRRLWSWLGKLLSAHRTQLVTIAPARLLVLRRRWSALGRLLR